MLMFAIGMLCLHFNVLYIAGYRDCPTLQDWLEEYTFEYFGEC